jgi:hypothetical protein
MNFIIYNENTYANANSNSNSNITISNFDISDFNSIYKDEFIELTWNPLYKQLQFKIFKNHNNFVRGGYNILNSLESSVFNFQFENNNNDEYFFSSSDGNVNNMNTSYNFISNWNRALLWLSSVFDNYFPYYNITINSNSSNAVAIIEKYIL